MFHCCLIVLSSVCTVLCLIAILDVQANQRARCDIHCHWKSGILYYLHISSTVCVCLESPAPASKELSKIILKVLQHHSATKNMIKQPTLALNGENYLNFNHYLASLRTPLWTQVRGTEDKNLSSCTELSMPTFPCSKHSIRHMELEGIFPSQAQLPAAHECCPAVVTPKQQSSRS